MLPWDATRPGQILVSQRVHAGVEDVLVAEELPPFTLKGFNRPVTAFAVTAIKR